MIVANPQDSFKGLHDGTYFYKRVARSGGSASVRVSTFANPVSTFANPAGVGIMVASLMRGRKTVYAVDLFGSARVEGSAGNEGRSAVILATDGALTGEGAQYLMRILSDDERAILSMFGVPTVGIHNGEFLKPTKSGVDHVTPRGGETHFGWWARWRDDTATRSMRDGFHSPFDTREEAQADLDKQVAQTLRAAYPMTHPWDR